MSRVKPPFKLSFYLDKRHTSYLPVKHKYYASSQDNRLGRHSLYLRAFCRFEKKPKMFNTGLLFTEKSWDKIRECNTLKEKDQEVLMIRHLVDAFMNRHQEYNIEEYKTIKQYTEALNKNIKAITPEKSYLLGIWDKYMNLNRKYLSDSNFEHHKAAVKSFFAYLITIKPTIDKKFLIQNIDKPLILGFVEWYTSKPKNNSINTAHSYLIDLKTVLNFAGTLGLLSDEENIFRCKNHFIIPPSERKAKEMTLSDYQLKLVLEGKPANEKEQKAKDIFMLCFCMSGLRVNDVICLEKKNLRETKGEKYFKVIPFKTRKYSKVTEILVTPEIQKIIDKYPGKGKFVLDCLPPDLDLDVKGIMKKGKNYYRSLVDALKMFSNRIEGLPKLSWGYARYSVNHYLLINQYASRDQIAEILVHSNEVSKGYFSDVGNQKFRIQEKLSDVMNEKKEKNPLGK